DHQLIGGVRLGHRARRRPGGLPQVPATLVTTQNIEPVGSWASSMIRHRRWYWPAGCPAPDHPPASGHLLGTVPVGN
ncbi:TPA: hypothetical protein ACNV5A_004615, partial [Aeromonas hydrophila]